MAQHIKGHPSAKVAAAAAAVTAGAVASKSPGFWGAVKEGLLYVDAGVRATANFVTFGLADKLAAGANTAIGSGTIEQNLAREQARTDYDKEHRAGAVAVGEAVGVAATIATGTIAAKAAVKGTVAAGKAAADTARSGVAAAKSVKATGAANAAAKAAIAGTEATAGRVAIETAKVAVKEGVKGTGRLAVKGVKSATENLAKTTVSTIGTGASVAATFGIPDARGNDPGSTAHTVAQIADSLGASGLAQSITPIKYTAEDHEYAKENGIDLGKIEQKSGFEQDQKLAAAATGVAALAAGGLTLIGKVSPLGRLASMARNFTLMGSVAGASTMAVNTAAAGAASAEEMAGVSHDTATTGAGIGVAVAGGAAAGNSKVRSWVADKARALGGAFKEVGWLGRAFKAVGIAGTAMVVVDQASSMNDATRILREGSVEQAKVDALTERDRRAAELAAAPRVLSDSAMQEIFDEATAAKSPPAAEPARAEVTPAYNAQAVRKPEGQRPAVVAAAAPPPPPPPSRVVGGSGLQVPLTQAGELRVTQEGYDGFGQGGPEPAAVAAVPAVNYDSFGNVIAQPQTQAAAAESARVQAILDAGAAGYKVDLPASPATGAGAGAGAGINTAGLLDARLQLGQDGAALPPESSAEPQPQHVALRRDLRSPGMA